MLNDFGFAVKNNSTNSFAGTKRFAPNDVLRQLLALPPSFVCSTFRHDLESAVKLIVCHTSAWASHMLTATTDDTTCLLELWLELEAQHEGLKAALNTARNVVQELTHPNDASYEDLYIAVARL